MTSDLGTGLSTAITKDGQTTATARIPFAQGINSSLVTDATSTTTGSIITAGGVGIAKSLYVGTGISGALNGTVGATTPSTGAFTTLSATGQISGTKNDGVQGLFYGYCPDGAYVGTDAGSIQIGNFSTAKGQFQYTTAGHVFIDNTYNSTNGHIKLRVKTAGTPVVALDASDTGVAVTGTLSATTTGQVGTTLGVGAATPSASGAGITFPATQSASTDANTLDDYEEGTFTPTLGGTAVYDIQTGRYTKIGRFVHFYIALRPTSLGTGSTTVISGLPFTVGDGDSGCVGNGYATSSANSYYSLTFDLAATSVTICLRTASTSDTGNNSTAFFQNNARIYMNGVYAV